MNVCGKDVHIEGTLVRIGHLDGDKYEMLSDPEAVLDAIRRSRNRLDIFTFMQALPHTSPQFTYPMEWDNVAALPVSTFDRWMKDQIRNKVRNMVRKAEKSGVMVREVPFDDFLVQGITRIYNESPIRQGRPFWHYGKDVEGVRRTSETFLDRSIFIGAFLGQELIGFAKLVPDEPRGQAGLMHIMSLIRHRDKAPTNALIAQAVRSCADRQIPYLVYSNFSYGNKQRDSLSEFKEHNGFQRIELPRYFVPVTATGRLALHLGLHRRLSDRVPEQLLVHMRRIRSRWYSRKVQVSQEA
jgi:hypothetical protein